MRQEKTRRNIRDKCVKEKAILFHDVGVKGLLTIFLIMLMIVFPWYFRDKYIEMSYHKWIFYVSITIVFLLFSITLVIIGRILGRKNKYNFSDLLVLTYGILVTISFINSVDPQAAFMGTDGWYMGYVAQILFVLTYFVFSTQAIKAEILIVLNYIGSLFCFIVAIFQRYGNDFLHLYWNMPDEIVRDYLSTIGNRTWFSAYVCAVCPIGIYLFWQAKKRLQLIIYGIYTYIAFACIVVTNSDSAYAGILVVLYILFLFSLREGEYLQRFCRVLALWSGACLSMALLRIPYESKVRMLRGLSKVFLKIEVGVTLLIISLLLMFLARKFAYKISSSNMLKWKKGIVYSTFIVFGILVLIILLNSTGGLEKYFGLTIQNQYFLFNEAWGDDRGSSWMLTLRMLLDLPLKQKLFGVGPDCFAYYAYSNPEYSYYLNGFWGEAVLANAHNEWLNSIFCMGILGGLIYIGIFVYIMLRCFRYTGEQKAIIPAVGLCVAGYMAHNFFCYQQVSATGVIFVLMGIAMYQSKESVKRN